MRLLIYSDWNPEINAESEYMLIFNWFTRIYAYIQLVHQNICLYSAGSPEYMPIFCWLTRIYAYILLIQQKRNKHTWMPGVQLHCSVHCTVYVGLRIRSDSGALSEPDPDFKAGCWKIFTKPDFSLNLYWPRLSYL